MEKEKIDVSAYIETGVFNEKKVLIPPFYDKSLANNVQDLTAQKHLTPLGAGTIMWANEKVVLQPAIKELNNDKIQTSLL